MSSLHFVAILLISALITLKLTQIIILFARSHKILDVPNKRSSHENPTPRGGGAAIVIVILLGSVLLTFLGLIEFDQFVQLSIGGMVVLALLGAWDDIREAKPWLRVPVQIALSLFFVILWVPGKSIWLFEFWQIEGILLGLFGFLYVMWMINLFNFMDGIDGLAGGQAFLGALGITGIMSVSHTLHGETGFTLAICALIAGGAIGFLRWNFPPAKIFMGDVGSMPLGYLFAGLTLQLAQSMPLWIIIFPLLPFVVDGTLTLLKRASRLERVWEAHKSHYYQRAVQLGHSHRDVTLFEYTLIIACSLLAIGQVGGIFHSVLIAIIAFALFAIPLIWIETRSSRSSA